MKIHKFQILDNAKPSRESIRGLNFAAVKHMAVKVPKCRCNRSYSLGRMNYNDPGLREAQHMYYPYTNIILQVIKKLHVSGLITYGLHKHFCHVGCISIGYAGVPDYMTRPHAKI
jgi:hypothetical protein